MKKVLIFIVVLISAWSCDEVGFLSVYNPEEVSQTDCPTSLSHVQSLLTAAYGSLHKYEFLGSFWSGYAMYTLDHTTDFVYRNDKGWISIGAGTLSTENDKISAEWNAINAGIHCSNIAIEGARTYRRIAPYNELAGVDRCEGQALFLRAFYWWHMMSLYAEPDLDGVGIPILRHSTDSYESAQVPRLKTGECYAAIVETLKQAIPLLEGQDDKFRADVWAAKGLLAKTYLFMDEKELARSLLEDILIHSGKRLVSYSWLMNMYNGDLAYEHPSESFFELENALYSSNVYAYGARLICGSSLSRWFSHYYIRYDAVRQSADYSNLYCHDRNLLRFGYTCDAPLNHLIHSTVPPAEGRGYVPFNTQFEGYSLDMDYIMEQRAMKDRALRGASLPSDPDPRMYLCVMVPYIDSCKVEGGLSYAPVGQSAQGEWYSAGSGNDASVFYGFPLRKYQFLDGELIKDGGDCTGENIYFMRLPEVYLMYAEVMASLGNTEVALEYINKVHRRAYGRNPEMPSTVDYKSLSDRTATSDPSDHLAFDPLKYEYFVELFGEFRWWEYVRHFRIGPQEASFYKILRGPGDSGNTIIEFPEHHYAQPVYWAEIETNPNLVQTPGYD